jgi:hypothetical protein
LQALADRHSVIIRNAHGPQYGIGQSYVTQSDHINGQSSFATHSQHSTFGFTRSREQLAERAMFSYPDLGTFYNGKQI